MPTTFTDDMIFHRLEGCQLSTSGTPEERRERFAQYVEQTWGDHVEGWEIRTGRPWTQMTSEEARTLIEQHPLLIRNPGVLSRLAEQGSTPMTIDDLDAIRCRWALSRDDRSPQDEEDVRRLIAALDREAAVSVLRADLLTDVHRECKCGFAYRAKALLGAQGITCEATPS